MRHEDAMKLFLLFIQLWVTALSVSKIGEFKMFAVLVKEHRLINFRPYLKF